MDYKICTSIEQSKKLIELGIDVNTADMFWTYDFTINDINGINVISNKFKPEENDISAWSLSALLKQMPSGKLLLQDLKTAKYKLIGYNKDTDFYNDPIDAVVDMMIWLLGLLKNES